MGIVRVKNPPKYMRDWEAYRYQRLGGHFGPASPVRRIDPATGEVTEVVNCVNRIEPPPRQPRK